MRRHAKAPSDGTTTSRTGRPGRALLLTLAVIATAMAVAAPSASALKAHFFLEDFGSASQPSFNNPGSLAVDQSNGDVLVVELVAEETATIKRYRPDGTPADFSALGTNVIDGAGPGEDATPQGELVAGEQSRLNQIAVDNSGGPTDGNIYLATGKAGEAFRIVYMFSSVGKYLGELTQFKEGANASGALTGFVNAVCGVAVGPDGSLYVGDRGGFVHKYVPSAGVPGNEDNVANFGYPTPCTLAAGAGPSAGFIFVNSSSGVLSKVDATTGEAQYRIAEGGNGVTTVAVDPGTGDLYTGISESLGGTFLHYDASGSSGATLLAEAQTERNVAGIAISDDSGRVYVSESFSQHLVVFSPLLTLADVTTLAPQEVSATRARMRGTVDPDGAAVTECKFEYGTVESGTFSSSLPCEGPVPTDSETHAVSAVVSHLPADGAAYHYRLVVTNVDGKTSTSDVGMFDLPLRVFTGGPTSVMTNTALAHGLVRPEGEEVTECLFEYGLSTSYGSSAPCSPGASSLPTDFGVHAVIGQLGGLAEFTVYHYRLTFMTAAGTFAGKDELFRTLGASGLPDDRRYEQVSPVDKNHSDILPLQSVASVDGNRLITDSSGGFAGAPTTLLQGTQYLSTRGPQGWLTESITLPGGKLQAGTGYEAFTSDLSKGVIQWPEDTQLGPHDPSAVRGANLYLRDNGTGTFSLLNGTLSEVEYAGDSVVAGSADFSHVAITDANALTPEAEGTPCANHEDLVPCAYEWDEGALRLASIVNGEPVEGAVGAYHSTRPCGYEHAMSEDGMRLFFTSPVEESVGGQRLYARENGTTTTPIGTSERTLPGGVSGAAVNYQNAEAAHGNLVIFTTKNSLVNADDNETNDLYLYDYTKPAGERLTLISADENPNAPTGAEIDGGGIYGCAGVVGASDNLRRIYFVADNQIVSGEPEEAGPKLFLWDDTGPTPTVSYIANLNASDNRVWQAPLTEGSGQSRQARLSADGRYLVFLSSAKLTDFENEGRKEVYRYDAVAQTMECASCSPDASPAEGDIGFEEVALSGSFGRAIYNHVSTAVSERGQVFFQTTRGLIPSDSNGKSDVYEYENGRLALISAGEGQKGSYFLDASPSGRDVFFTTADQLVGWDKDENTDAYDAREGGGFPEPPLAPPGCNGDACQPAPNAPNDATPASSSFEGSGNVTEPRASRCAKGKVRRHGRCLKRRHAKKKRHAAKHHRQARTATRSNG